MPKEHQLNRLLFPDKASSSDGSHKNSSGSSSGTSSSEEDEAEEDTESGTTAESSDSSVEGLVVATFLWCGSILRFCFLQRVVQFEWQ